MRDGRMDKQINKPTEQTESKTDSTAQGGTSGLRCKLVKLAKREKEGERVTQPQWNRSKTKRNETK